MDLLCYCTIVREVFVGIAFSFSFFVDLLLWYGLLHCSDVQSIGLRKRTSIMGTNPYVAVEWCPYPVG